MTEQMALSLWQPWAWAVVYAGKDVENRVWRTHYRGPLLIHASKRKPPKREIRGMLEFLHEHGMLVDNFTTEQLRELTEPKLGGVIGRVDLVDCVEHSDSPWFNGPFGFVLANPAPLPFIGIQGQRKFFKVRMNP